MPDNRKQIVVLGGGFAGLWAALGAARAWDVNGRAPDELAITLVDRNPYHAIRVRNYEEDLSDVTIPFTDLLDPVGIAHKAGNVAAIDIPGQTVEVATTAGRERLRYDRLVLALGSQLHRPSIPGLAEHAFDIDTFDAATRLAEHLASLSRRPSSPGRDTVLVVGAGLTGIELASELPGRLRRLFGAQGGRVILADAAPVIGSDMGEHARPVIIEALGALGVEMRVGVAIARITPTGAVLASGETIATETVVWCAGMRAHPLMSTLPVTLDRGGRVPVDEFTRVTGVANVFGAGDCAWSLVDGTNSTVMSCQHGRPMGRFAGHNAVADLIGEAMIPFIVDWYTTILDLGDWGAVCTWGRDRAVTSVGTSAKRTKMMINRERIYPPRSRDRDELLAAAAPIIPSAPPVGAAVKS